VHELAHHSADGIVIDQKQSDGITPIWGQDGAMWLAQNDPANTVNHADCYEYYASVSPYCPPLHPDRFPRSLVFDVDFADADEASMEGLCADESCGVRVSIQTVVPFESTTALYTEIVINSLDDDGYAFQWCSGGVVSQDCIETSGNPLGDGMLQMDMECGGLNCRIEVYTLEGCPIVPTTDGIENARMIINNVGSSWGSTQTSW